MPDSINNNENVTTASFSEVFGCRLHKN